MTTLDASLGAIILRELTSLRHEIEAYPSDESLWTVVPGISNSGGTLALHLAGNLQHFLGERFAPAGYRRNREAEFATRDLPRSDVVKLVDAAIASMERTFRAIRPADLEKDYPEPVAKMRLETGDFLTHLACHLAYHLGQVDYHRRIVTGSSTVVGTVAPGKLKSARPVE